MNKKKLIVLFVFAFLLSGCKDKVNELYDGNAYASENFIDNYYEIWNEDLINNVSTTINYELTVDNPETPDSEGIVKIDYKQRVAMGINPSLNYIDAVDQINPDTKEYLKGAQFKIYKCSSISKCSTKASYTADLTQDYKSKKFELKKSGL